MSVHCPHCGSEAFDGLDSDFVYCDQCDELFNPDDAEDAADEVYCAVCGDWRPVDDSGCCMRCGEEVDA